METVRWNVVVTPETDKSVRMFLAEQGGARKGSLSKLIEEAVQTYLFERAVEQTKAEVAASGMSEEELNDLIDESVAWARAKK